MSRPALNDFIITRLVRAGVFSTRNAVKEVYLKCWNRLTLLLYSLLVNSVSARHFSLKESSREGRATLMKLPHTCG
jgi:hypothetical protein